MNIIRKTLYLIIFYLLTETVFSYEIESIEIGEECTPYFDLKKAKGIKVEKLESFNEFNKQPLVIYGLDAPCKYFLCVKEGELLNKVCHLKEVVTELKAKQEFSELYENLKIKHGDPTLCSDSEILFAWVLTDKSISINYAKVKINPGEDAVFFVGYFAMLNEYRLETSNNGFASERYISFNKNKCINI